MQFLDFCWISENIYAGRLGQGNRGLVEVPLSENFKVARFGAIGNLSDAGCSIPPIDSLAHGTMSRQKEKLE